MTGADRKKLLERVSPNLPPGYSTELYDDFVNYEWVYGLGTRSCRVLRLVGERRSVMVFANDEDPLKRVLTSPRYHCLYLEESGDAIQFSPKALYNSSNSKLSFDRFLGEFLVKNEALSFHGTNWVGKFSAFLVTFLPRWEKEFSGIASMKTKETRP
jgi:hypothetical protein